MSIATATMDDTRHRLIRAGEQLYAARGLDGVSLREIAREAGARNTGAIQYHFGDRSGLLRAILDRHTTLVDARRHVLLDGVEAATSDEPGDSDVRTMADALVRPLASMLGDRDGGRDFLVIQAHVLNRADFRDTTRPSRTATDSLQRWRAVVEDHLSDQAIGLHRRFSAITLTTAELGRRAQSRPRRDDRLFVANLVDLVAGVLGAEPSATTLAILDERP